MTLLAARNFSCEVETMPDTVLAYWLLPAPPAREFFRATIGRLAAQYDAPLFEPHLTLAVGSDAAIEARRILNGLASRRSNSPLPGSNSRPNSPGRSAFSSNPLPRSTNCATR